MKVGFIGLGKLGLPCALAIESHGHDVMGYDISESVKNWVREKQYPHQEVGMDNLLERSRIQLAESFKELAEFSDIIFLAIQTPHDKEYEGITRIPEERKDFNYEHLVSGVKGISEALDQIGQDKIVIIISTCLPGTIRREVRPILSKRVNLCYNPFFIAMGTTIRDFLEPEFVLLGVDENAEENTVRSVKKFYRTLHSSLIMEMSIESAEMTKVAYNTFIGMKLGFVNTLMEICHKVDGANVDDVTDALKRATDRLISPRYLTAGMGDGGGCHPRDNIALSKLAEDLNLSFDFFDSIMMSREKQTEWLGDLLIEQYTKHNKSLPIKILGKAFKAETTLTTGSPSILLKNILDEKGISSEMYDQFQEEAVKEKAIFFIGTRHMEYLYWRFPAGSVVIDPWRYINKQEGVELIPVGDSSAKAVQSPALSHKF